MLDPEEMEEDLYDEYSVPSRVTESDIANLSDADRKLWRWIRDHGPVTVAEVELAVLDGRLEL